MFRLMFSRRWWWTTLLALGAIAVTIRLGIWQLDRYSQNHSFNAHLTAMQAAPAVDISAADADLRGMEYRAVRAAGTYDFAHQVAIRNQVWTQSWGDDVGYALLTPLVLPDGRAVLVERGWIPLQNNTRVSWGQFDQPGPVSVTGVIRLPAAPEMGGGVPDPTLAPGQAGLDFWNLVNLGRLQQQIPHPLLPVYIQQTPDPDQTGLPYRASPVPDLADDGSNLGYATVWFSFALLLFFGYPVYLKKQGVDNRLKK
jgi:surfeit locus 1 family protein